MKDKKRVVILGSTGTIGKMAADVLSKSDEFEVVGLLARKSLKAILEMSSVFPKAMTALTEEVSDKVNFTGAESVEALLESTKPDIVVVGVSGFIGLKYSILSAKYSKRLCLANKESIVTGGKFFLDTVKSYGCEIIPVDSEHNAIFQLIDSEKSKVESIYLTASGGAIRDLPVESLESVTPSQVLKHPVWNMGSRITVDSSTMFNKGLEVMEAHFLFGFPPEKINVLVHPEGKIHGIIELEDGTFKAFISKADMRIPIAYALLYPKRSCKNEKFDLFGNLNLLRPDPLKYPALELAYDCLKEGDGSRIAYNAADEVAVEYFLRGKIGFLQIYEIVKKVVEKGWEKHLNDYESIEKIDKESRKMATELLNRW
ncbi:MAG: 1-deoxy-D-xylulose-5-phosphate reductoisomerase [Mesoaciditoga sp.]|uniref:1-deoxy-D-xylulose-5-phosphate reductoisomerase n=1 Tax=Athalassotoga sp. TaxID=2022597 RepID=UPI000CC7EF37|nr:MAG: 1-deoxy-D-xylulose-5-phosphate reductoisomerase [Mesoaciditoga sp.]HEU24845.1 1-deoxy-D-xylulose-5-phosphate reductoisomerase [Mesoaciditoga lauensis]